MPIQHKQQNYTHIYTLIGPFDANLAHEYCDCVIDTYPIFGDAGGAIMDWRQVTEQTFSGIKTITARMNKASFPYNPVVYIGLGNKGISQPLIMAYDALTGVRGEQRHFFAESMAEGHKFIDNWFIEQRLDREALKSQFSAVLPHR